MLGCTTPPPKLPHHPATEPLPTPATRARAACDLPPPQTRDETWPRLDFLKANSLTFKKPDHAKYPSMNLAYAAGRAGGTMTGVLSAANEQVRRLRRRGGVRAGASGGGCRLWG